MSEPETLATIVHHSTGPLFLTKEHFNFLKACCEPGVMDINDLCTSLLGSAIDTEMAIQRELLSEQNDPEPSLTLDADTNLRMNAASQPWEPAMVTEPASSSLPPTDRKR